MIVFRFCLNACEEELRRDGAAFPAIELIQRALLRRGALSAGDALVLQNPDDDATVFRLSLDRLVSGYLPALAHGAGSQHVG
jgi:hypothetical protein